MNKDIFFWRIGWRGWLILSLMVLVLLFGLCSATNEGNIETYYAGNTYTYNTDIKEMYWEVDGNSPNLNGLNISHINNQIVLDFDLLFKPDNFTLTFYDSYTREEVYTYHSGGSRRKIVEKVFENKTEIPGEGEGATTPDESEPEPEKEDSFNWKVFIYFFGIFIFLTIILVMFVRKKLKGGRKNEKDI